MFISRRFYLFTIIFFLSRKILFNIDIFPIYSLKNAKTESMGSAGKNFSKIFFELENSEKFDLKGWKLSFNTSIENFYSNDKNTLFNNIIKEFLGSKSYIFFVDNRFRIGNSFLQLGITKIQYFKKLKEEKYQILGQMQFYLKNVLSIGNDTIRLITAPSIIRYLDEESKIEEAIDTYQIQESSYPKLSLGLDNFLMLNILGGYFYLGGDNFPSFYYSLRKGIGFILPDLKVAFKKTFYPSRIVNKCTLVFEIDNILSNDLYKNYDYDTNFWKKLHVGFEIYPFYSSYSSFKIRGGFSHFYPTFGLSLRFLNIVNFSYAFFSKSVSDENNIFFHSVEFSLGN